MYATKLFMPSWWVGAFDFSSLNSDPMKFLEISKSVKFMPYYEAAELSSLSLFISKIQESLLSGNATISLNSEFLEKLASTPKETLVHSKVMQSIGGMRFLSGNLAASFVEKEEVLGTSDTSLGVKLKLTSQGEELFLGVSDAYYDAQRVISNLEPTSSVLGDLPPIGVSKSLWLDLQPVEASLLLRMEKGMQWDLNWLHFNGTFGSNLDDLFQGLTIKLRKNVSTEFNKRLRVLEKLGRKLVEHGAIQVPTKNDYLAFENPSEVNLVWRLSKEGSKFEDVQNYFSDCAEFFDKRTPNSFVPKVLTTLLGSDDESRSMIDKLDAFYEKSKLQAEEDANSLLCLINRNKIVTKFGFFCELVLRQSRADQFAISGELASLVDLDLADLEGSWLKYLNAIKPAKSSLVDILDCEEGSIASLKFLNTIKIDGLLATLEAPQPKLPIREPKVKATSIESTSKKDGKELKTSGLGAKIRKIARDELERLKRQQPAEYEALEAKYFNSMSVEEKKTWDNVVSLMSKERRDDQLKLRLIRFMVENPSLWKARASGDSS